MLNCTNIYIVYSTLFFYIIIFLRSSTYNNVLKVIYDIHSKNQLPNIYFSVTNKYNIFTISEINSILEKKSNINQLEYLITIYENNTPAYIPYV